MASEARTSVAPVAAEADVLQVPTELDDGTATVIVRWMRTVSRSSGERPGSPYRIAPHGATRVKAERLEASGPNAACMSKQLAAWPAETAVFLTWTAPTRGTKPTP
ncbi:hypothetical protein [Streptomyces sp. NPDC052042]|uniref:hypothetical protein n=1 Tax=Streptomyces sp. NPDC052042 TaxID=3365683 RepID=UPI0037D0A14E